MAGDLPRTLPPARPPSLPRTAMPHASARPHRAPAATGFNSAPLVRWLAALQVAEVAPSPSGFAERLSGWLDWTDAIALAAALHDAPRAAAPVPVPDAAASAQALITACQRTQHDLAQAIHSDKRFITGPDGAGPPPAPPPSAPAAPGAAAARRHPLGFAPWRRLHQTHQRAMAARITPLRERLRAGLALHSPALARLAALDAVLEASLAPREDHLLSGVPTWLEKALARATQADPAADAACAESVGRRLQTALLAELDLRLQPLQGLVAALAEAVAGGPGPHGGHANAAEPTADRTAHHTTAGAPGPT